MRIERQHATIQLTFEVEERRIVAELVGQLVQLLAHAATPGAREHDPAIKALLPDAVLDPDEAREYRAMLGDATASAKRRDAESLLALLDGDERSISGDVEAALGWMRVLSGLRLVLHQRLIAFEQGADPDVTPDDVEQIRQLSGWLGVVQEGLVASVADVT